MTTKEIIAAIFAGIQTTAVLAYFAIGKITWDQSLLVLTFIAAPNAVGMIVARKQAEVTK